MSDESFDESAMLAATRRAASPTPEQVTRVLQATRSTLAGSAATSAVAPAPASAATGATLARAWLPNAIGAVSIAIVSGVFGYQLCLRTIAARDAVVERDAVVARDAIARDAIAARDIIAPPSAPLPPSAPVAPSMLPQPSVQPASSRAQAPRRLIPARPASSGNEPSTRSMQEEIEAMRRIERALRDHDPRQALALLSQLERSVPSGKLMQERQAASAMARCALGLGSAHQVASDFAARYPGSAYLQRVRQTCAPDQRNEAGPDTHE